MLYPKKDGGFEPDATIDASLYAMFAFGVYDANDIKIHNTMKAIEETLWVKTKIGGVARYERDQYQRKIYRGTRTRCKFLEMGCITRITIRCAGRTDKSLHRRARLCLSINMESCRCCPNSYGLS